MPPERSPHGASSTRKFLPFFAPVILLVMAGLGRADTFYLKNGDIIEGRRAGETDARIRLEDATVKVAGDNTTILAADLFIEKSEIKKTGGAGEMVKAFRGRDADQGRRVYKKDKSREYYLRGLQAASAGRMEEAWQDFENSLKVDHDYTPARESLKLIKSVNDRETDPETAAALFGTAVYDDWVRRLKAWREAAAAHPECVPVRTLLGIGYLRNQRLDEALFEFLKVLRLDPDNAGAHNNIGVVYARRLMFDEAEREFELAARFNPDLAEARHNLETVVDIRDFIKELRRLDKNIDIDKVPLNAVFRTCSIFAF